MKRRYMIGMLLLWMPALAIADVTTETAWVQMSASKDSAAAFMTLLNSGQEDVKIASVETEIAGRSGFYSFIFLEGNVLMQEMSSVVVPANGRLKLTPGNSHLILKELKRGLQAGEQVKLKLNTTDGKSIEVAAEVR